MSTTRLDSVRLARLVLADAEAQRQEIPDIPDLEPGLHVVALPIGNRGDITLNALVTLSAVDAVVCEDTRVTGALLHAFGISRPLIALHDHNERARTPQVLKALQEGQRLALVSDAGTPLMADPGFYLVRACHDLGIPVRARPGACAPIVALACAGIPAHRFLFTGFLPPRKAARQRALQEIASCQATLVMCESPYRVGALLDDIRLTMPERGSAPAALAREMTKFYEEIRRGTLDELIESCAGAPPLRGEVIVMVAKGLS